MRHFDLNALSFLQIQLFIVAGRELNYTRTAKICNVTQPTVSRSMEALERTLGIQLFIRNGSHMRLSPAGKRLYAYFQEMIRQLEQNIAAAHELQQGFPPQLHLTCPETINHRKYLLPAIDSYYKTDFHTKIHYTLTEDLNQVLSDILTNKIDAAIVHTYSVNRLEKYPDICFAPLVTIPLSAFLLRTNPLSCKSAVTIQDLRAQKLYLPALNDNPEYFHMIMDYFYREGIVPQIASYTSSIVEGILNLHEDDEVNIADTFLMDSYHPHCVSVPILNTQSGLLILWRKHEDSDSAAARFVAYCRDYYDRYYTQQT